MQRFARLFQALDASPRTESKLAALERYLAEAPSADAAWGVYFLAGGKPRQVLPSAVLKREAAAAAGLPEWLFEEAYHAAGDLAETIAHVLPPPAGRSSLGLAAWVTERLLPLRAAAEAEQVQALHRWWGELDAAERFLLTKLIGGGFRVGVSRLLVQRALARHAGLPPEVVAQRMMGWTDLRHRPDAPALARLLAPAAEGATAADPGTPYPFYLAHPLEAPDAQAQALGQRLGAVSDWLAEWKYDGIRAQLVRRAGGVWLWSRGEELMAGRFPEVEAWAQALPEGTVLDGELMTWDAADQRPGAFQALQTRLQRKTVGKKLLAEAPVVFMAYDLLEQEGIDLRARPLEHRRQALQALHAAQSALHAAGFRLSPEVALASWEQGMTLRAHSRERGVEGLMLKHRQAPYGVGRTKPQGLAAGGWWKWKVQPLAVDAVLIYAQAGHGRRAGLYTDYTFAVWSRPPADAAEAQAVAEAIAARRPAEPGALQLLPFAKAYSGLSDEEFQRVDKEIRAHTVERFGPVRSVRPTMVVELGFEGLQPSGRHKSGLAVRFPRMLRLRPDKPLHEADDLARLQALMPARAP